MCWRLAVLLTLAVASTANAAPIRYGFEFRFDGSIISDTAGTGFSPGDVVTFRLEIDPDADSDPASNGGTYLLSALDVVFPFATYTSGPSVDLGFSSVRIFDQTPGSLDRVIVTLDGTITVPGSLGGNPTIFHSNGGFLVLDDSTGELFWSDEAPLALDVGDFDAIFGPTVSSDWSFNIDGATLFFRGPLTLQSIDVTVVPEPATGLILGVGLICIARLPRAFRPDFDRRRL